MGVALAVEARIDDAEAALSEDALDGIAIGALKRTHHTLMGANKGCTRAACGSRQIKMPGAGSLQKPLHFACDFGEGGLAASARVTARSNHSATRSMWASVSPREVMAGVPSRTPDGSKGLRGS